MIIFIFIVNKFYPFCLFSAHGGGIDPSPKVCYVILEFLTVIFKDRYFYSVNLLFIKQLLLLLPILLLTYIQYTCTSASICVSSMK